MGDVPMIEHRVGRTCRAATAICLALSLGACGRHWYSDVVGVGPTPAHSVSAKVARSPADLRVALAECAAKSSRRQPVALDSLSDDELTATFAVGESREFNECMRDKGWVTIPDVTFVP